MHEWIYAEYDNLVYNLQVQPYLDNTPDGAALVAGSGTSSERVHAQNLLTKTIDKYTGSYVCDTVSDYTYQMAHSAISTSL